MPRFVIRDFGKSLVLKSASLQFARLKTSKILSDQVNATVSIWFKTTIIPDSSHIRALYCERAGSGNDIWKLEITNNKVLRFVHRDDASVLDNITNTTGVNVCNGEWRMGTLVKSGTSITIYVNAAVDKTGTLTGSDTLTNANQQVQVGEDVRDASTYLDGLVDELWLFTRALSAQEVSDLYYKGSVSDLTGLVGHYQFDEGSGTAVIDNAGVQANGSLSGSPSYSDDVFMKPRSIAL